MVTESPCCVAKLPHFNPASASHSVSNLITGYLTPLCFHFLIRSGADGKASAFNAETQVQSLGREDPLEKETATHSSILTWKTPWTEEPGVLQSMGSQRVRHNLAAKPRPPKFTLGIFYAACALK